MEFLTCRELVDEGRRIITSGDVSYYPKYWIGQLGEEIPVCAEIKEKYKAITKYIRGFSTKVRAGVRTYWVGEGALRKLRSGSETVIDEFPVLV